MSDAMDIIDALPDISFIDDISLEDLQRTLITSFQDKYQEITGESITLSRADPNRIILLAVAQYLYQGLMQVDKAGKMNFLKYAYGDYLDNLGSLKGISRLQEQRASVDVLWELEEVRSQDTPIPSGTRVTGDGNVFFQTISHAQIPAGSLSKTIKMYCTTAGAAGNGFAPGEINQMADAVAFISSVVNTTESAGGRDVENDEDFLERIYLAPTGFSTAGSKDAYIYHAKSSGVDVGDVSVTSPSAGVVDVRFLMADNSIPSSTNIYKVRSYLVHEERKPLTDNVQVAAPEQVSYSIDVTYYIRNTQENTQDLVQTKIAEAVDSFQEWQRSKIGRSINPDELISRLIAAGAKRAVITSPVYAALEETQVAKCTSVNITYGGAEDD